MSIKIQFNPNIFNQMKVAADTCCSISSKATPQQFVFVKDFGIVFQHEDSLNGRSLFKGIFENIAFDKVEWLLPSKQLFVELLHSQLFGPVDKNCCIIWEFIPQSDHVKVILQQINKDCVIIRKNEYLTEKTIFKYYKQYITQRVGTKLEASLENMSA